MSRKKTIVINDEVEEIVSLKLEDVGGIKTKLTYNNVWNFNKSLVGKKCKRSNGEFFNLYGYTFWASSYNGEDYLGKQIIDKIKRADNFIIAGESFAFETRDILCLVEKYHKNPPELSKRLINLFECDRRKVESLREQNEKLNQELIKRREDMRLLERGFATIFYNSNNLDNSMKDVISLKKSGDTSVLDELKNMFNQNESKIGRLLNEERTYVNKPSEVNVINLNNRKTLEKEGL
jgi:hypothetical protein